MKNNRIWGELTCAQRATIKVVAALDIGLLAAALCDLAHRKPDEVRGSRAMWTALSFVDFIGPISYFTIGRKGGCCFCCEEKTEDSPDTLEETDTVSE